MENKVDLDKLKEAIKGNSLINGEFILYDFLGVKPSVSYREITEAYKRKGKDDKNAKLAYEILSDSKQREKYHKSIIANVSSAVKFREKIFRKIGLIISDPFRRNKGVWDSDEEII